jgi:uncharacterized protein (DUF58 family)
MPVPVGMEVPAARQGPGKLPPSLVEQLDLAIARRAAGVLPGERRAPGVGIGTELSQLREYQPGDDVRQLDWAASARTGVPHVRLQVPERALTTWLIVDASPSMAFGTAERLKSDVAEGVVLVMGRLAARRGGRVALLTAGRPSERFLPPRGGRGAIAPLRHALAEGVAADGYNDPNAIERALRRAGKLARHRGLVVVISDFRGERNWRRAMAVVRHRHAVLAVEIRDPREGQLPPSGHLAVVDPETGDVVEVDTQSRTLRERFAAAELARRGAVAADLRHTGAEHVVLSTDGDWLRSLGGKLR